MRELEITNLRPGVVSLYVVDGDHRYFVSINPRKSVVRAVPDNYIYSENLRSCLRHKLVGVKEVGQVDDQEFNRQAREDVEKVKEMEAQEVSEPPVSLPKEEPAKVAEDNALIAIDIPEDEYAIADGGIEVEDVVSEASTKPAKKSGRSKSRSKKK